METTREPVTATQVFEAYTTEEQAKFMGLLQKLEETLKEQYRGKPDALQVTRQKIVERAVQSGVPEDYANLSVGPMYSRLRRHFIENIPEQT